jgi:hypothetical protein
VCHYGNVDRVFAEGRAVRKDGGRGKDAWLKAELEKQAAAYRKLAIQPEKNTNPV